MGGVGGVVSPSGSHNRSTRFIIGFTYPFTCFMPIKVLFVAGVAVLFHLGDTFDLI